MNRLTVPPELQHLIEKREASERRAERRRAAADHRKLDLGPAGAAKSAEALIATGADERRPEKNRRAKTERRQTARRKSTKRRS